MQVLIIDVQLLLEMELRYMQGRPHENLHMLDLLNIKII